MNGIGIVMVHIVIQHIIYIQIGLMVNQKKKVKDVLHYGIHNNGVICGVGHQ